MIRISNEGCFFFALLGGVIILLVLYSLDIEVIRDETDLTKDENFIGGYDGGV